MTEKPCLQDDPALPDLLIEEMQKVRGDRALLFAAAALAIKWRDEQTKMHLAYLGKIYLHLEMMKFDIRCAQVGHGQAVEEEKQRKRDKKEILIYRAKYGPL